MNVFQIREMRKKIGLLKTPKILIFRPKFFPMKPPLIACDMRKSIQAK